jgi:AraC family transcriptional regulator
MTSYHEGKEMTTVESDATSVSTEVWHNRPQCDDEFQASCYDENRSSAQFKLSFSDASNHDDAHSELSTNTALKHQKPYGLSQRSMERVVSYVEQHLCENIKLEHIASAASVSRFHFCRQFRVTTGQSPIAYIISKRIELARSLLFDEELEICDIALRLGFSDQSHFTRTFHRLTGYPPRRYIVTQRSST